MKDGGRQVTRQGMCYSDEGQQGLGPGAAATEQSEGWFRVNC